MSERTERKRPRRRGRSKSPDQDVLDAKVAAGGLTIADVDDKLLHLVTPDTAQSMRFFVTRLQRMRRDNFPETIAITSALSGEGVSTVTRSLAAILAHDHDRKVCIVETNWWVTGSEVSPSEALRATLAHVIDGRTSLDDAVLPTSDPRLFTLASGAVELADRPAVVAGRPFADSVAMLAKLYDIVILDVPPLLKSSEATTICAHADAVALVVRHGVTTERQVQMALELLTGQDTLGIILNRTTTSVPRVLRRITVPI